MLGHLLVADMDAERVEATKGTLVRTTIHHVSLALSHTLATCAMALAYVYIVTQQCSNSKPAD